MKSSRRSDARRYHRPVVHRDPAHFSPKSTSEQHTPCTAFLCASAIGFGHVCLESVLRPSATRVLPPPSARVRYSLPCGAAGSRVRPFRCIYRTDSCRAAFIDPFYQRSRSTRTHGRLTACRQSPGTRKNEPGTVPAHPYSVGENIFSCTGMCSRRPKSVMTRIHFSHTYTHIRARAQAYN